MEKLFKLAQNLKKLGYETEVFLNSQGAVLYLLDKLKGKTVGMGGSMTLKEIGLYEKLKDNSVVYWHWETPGVQKDAHLAEFYLLSANGISEDGVIINIDGMGNRVGSSIFGPREVIYVIGKNKIEDTYEKALYRARNTAAPKNAKRLNCKTPCTVDEKCHDCSSPDRICSIFSVLRKKPGAIKATVILINEDLGF